jgi:hypothetical protein
MAAGIAGRFVLLVACLGVGLGLGGCVIYLNPQCTDQIKNGEETGVDCGGGCGHCEVGQGCRTDVDCDESTCNGNVCTAFPCDNQVKDGQETDVDCGGPCRKCSGGRHCTVAADCASNVCVAGANTCKALTLSFADAVAYPSGDKTYALFSGDLNGDGRTDLAAANEQGSSISVFLSDGAGAFHLQGAPFTTGAYPTGGAIADFNGDGKLDVITADYHGNSVSILLNAGTGTGALLPRVTYPTLDGAETSNLAVGDLNNDGNPDVVATNPQQHSVTLFIGRADGTLIKAQDIQVGVTNAAQPYSAAIGDFDGDGNADLAIAEETSGTIIVRLGKGDGTFQPEASYEIGGVRDYIIITHDMNRDGKLDLLSANRGSDNVSVLIGRGDGTFRKPILSSLKPSVGPYSIAVDDFNQDGVPDIVTANFMSNDSTVLLGIGTGNFEPVINAGPTGIHPYGIATGDFDGDTHPDFATANSVSFDVTVKRNTGH